MNGGCGKDFAATFARPSPAIISWLARIKAGFDPAPFSMLSQVGLNAGQLTLP